MAPLRLPFDKQSLRLFYNPRAQLVQLARHRCQPVAFLDAQPACVDNVRRALAHCGEHRQNRNNIGAVRCVDDRRLRGTVLHRYAACILRQRRTHALHNLHYGLITLQRSEINTAGRHALAQAADAWNDHRIAMSLAVAAQVCAEPIVLTGAGSVSKSYPDFWKDYTSVGGKIEVMA